MSALTPAVAHGSWSHHPMVTNIWRISSVRRVAAGGPRPLAQRFVPLLYPPRIARLCMHRSRGGSAVCGALRPAGRVHSPNALCHCCIRRARARLLHCTVAAADQQCAAQLRAGGPRPLAQRFVPLLYPPRNERGYCAAP